MVLLFHLFIFSAAFFIRIQGLGLLPINHDEGKWVNLLFLKNNPFRMLAEPGVFFVQLNRIWDIALEIFPKASFLGDFIFRIRFLAVVIGSVTVILVYALGRVMYGNKAGIISSVLLWKTRLIYEDAGKGR